MMALSGRRRRPRRVQELTPHPRRATLRVAVGAFQENSRASSSGLASVADALRRARRDSRTKVARRSTICQLHWTLVIDDAVRDRRTATLSRSGAQNEPTFGRPAIAGRCELPKGPPSDRLESGTARSTNRTVFGAPFSGGALTPAGRRVSRTIAVGHEDLVRRVDVLPPSTRGSKSGGRCRDSEHLARDRRASRSRSRAALARVECG